jgi:transketolase
MKTKEMRAAYCDELIELAKNNDKIVNLEADLMKASGTIRFKEAFPNRSVDCGIAESNMIGIASGLSNVGFIPFCATFGCFASRRVFDQFFLSANYAQLSVNLTGTDPGVSAAFNGGTHMPFEDIGLMKNIPNLKIVEPSDATSVRAFTNLHSQTPGCSYTRLHRKDMPVIYNDDEVFEYGKAKVLKDGTDLTLFALGAIEVNQSLIAAEELAKKGISVAVIDILSIKPIDEELIVKYAKKTGKIITCENHQVQTGLSSEVAMILFKHKITADLKTIGVHDEFGQVGTLDFLLDYYKMSAKYIVEAALELL